VTDDQLRGDRAKGHGLKGLGDKVYKTGLITWKLSPRLEFPIPIQPIPNPSDRTNRVTLLRSIQSRTFNLHQLQLTVINRSNLSLKALEKIVERR
jgi:hypothetical protein